MVMIMNESYVLPMVDISKLTSYKAPDRLEVAKALDQACKDVGFLYIHGTQLKPELFQQLVNTAQAYFAQDENINVMVAGDQSIAYGEVMKLMSDLQQAGLDQVGLVTQQLK